MIKYTPIKILKFIDISHVFIAVVKNTRGEYNKWQYWYAFSSLVDGYEWEAIPTLEVYRPSLSKSAIDLADTYIVAVAGEDVLHQHLPCLDLIQADIILQCLLEGMRHHLFQYEI